METKPQQSWTAVYQDGRGLAVVSTGLLETAVRDNPERTLALTLLRSTRRTVGTDGEPNGLLLGDSHVPLSHRAADGSPDRVRLFTSGQTTGCRVYRSFNCAMPTSSFTARCRCYAAPSTQLHAGEGRRCRHQRATWSTAASKCVCSIPNRNRPRQPWRSPARWVCRNGSVSTWSTIRLVAFRRSGRWRCGGQRGGKQIVTLRFI